MVRGRRQPGGGRVAAQHLVSLGRRRIASIAGPADTHVAVARLDGFADALSVAQVRPTLVEHADFTREGGAAAMERLLQRRKPGLDAVSVASDNMAAGALQTLLQHRRGVPEDVAVVGFDDLPIGHLTQPSLTTIQQPIRSLGYEMARVLLAVVDGEKPSPLLLPTRLVVRESRAGAGVARRVLRARPTAGSASGDVTPQVGGLQAARAQATTVRGGVVHELGVEVVDLLQYGQHPEREACEHLVDRAPDQCGDEHSEGDTEQRPS